MPKNAAQERLAVWLCAEREAEKLTHVDAIVPERREEMKFS